MVKGKKNDKHKARRDQRREEAKKIAEQQAIVNAANAIANPLALLAPMFRKYDRNSLQVEFECDFAKNWTSEIQEWGFGITKRNMKDLYGKEWKDKEKQEEMLEDTAQYLIAKQEGSPVAFCHFRFDMDYDLAVLYCYEIQLEESVQRKGLGRFMMQLLELMAFQTQMRKVILTVFHDNKAAMSFYKSKLSYSLDETSPSAVDVEWEVNYEILSKPIKSKQSSIAA
ncbi:N-alpha-acetyltransferase 40-like isoform X2 [Watersipora subatra]|uniref:N-alpha-acetyltransferase 40-like isoform X2 n=1 Tax=Watersipora subatra TaxID=2589382 RepID=UPI00355BA05D